MLKGRVYWLLKFAIIFTLLAFPKIALSQVIEQEPNEPCTSAQIFGEVTLPFYVDGSLEYLDVDFFRFSAQPDTYLVANLEGMAGELPALGDPYLGLFSSNCVLLAGSDNFFMDAEIKFNVPADGEFILAATSFTDIGFTGSYSTGSYRLTIDQAPDPSVISGRVVDAETGIALPGNMEPYAYVRLFECDTADCFYSWDINNQNTDSEGRFYFDSTWYAGDLGAGIYQLEVSAREYITTRTDPLILGDAQQLDLGDIALEPQTLGDSVTGRLVDAVTGLPLPGTNWPYAMAELSYCLDGPTCNSWSWLNSLNANSDGVFLFTTDYMGNGLVIGWYRVRAYANDYDPGDSGVFELTENEREDLGDITLMPPPVTFSEVRPCGDLPPEGGKCRYSVRVTSNLPSEVKLGAWSIVYANSIGSELGWSQFQAGQLKTVDLNTGENKVVRFSFDVPDTVQNGAYICPNIWVGLGEDSAYFDTLAYQDPLFCITKGLTGTYSVLSKQAAQAVIRAQKGKPIRSSQPGK